MKTNARFNRFIIIQNSFLLRAIFSSPATLVTFQLHSSNIISRTDTFKNIKFTIQIVENCQQIE